MDKKIYGIPIPLIVIGLLVVGYLFVPAVSTGVNGVFGSISSFLGLSAAGVGGKVYTGNINFIESQQDMLAGAAASPTSPTYRFFYTKPTTSAAGGISLTVTGTTLSAPESGSIWIACYGGSDFYVDSAKMAALNLKVKSGYWADLDVNNSPEYIVEIDTSTAGVNGQAQTPTLTTIIPLVKADVAITDDSPADVTGIGAVATTTTVTWKLSGITANYASRISRVYVTMNTTLAGGKCTPEIMTLSGGWLQGTSTQTYWSGPIANTEGSTSYSYYVNGVPDPYEYQNGIAVQFGPGSSDALFVSITFRMNLSAGNKIVATLYYDAVSSAGAITSVNDPVTLAA